MYCPECHSEYRPGFTRCAPCDVDLVASPDEIAAEAGPEAGGAANASDGAFVDYCGFVDLDDARRERDRLREHGVLARIAIRETPPGSLDVPVREEYWLRVSGDGFAVASRVLGFDPVEEPDGDGFRCDACGAHVEDDAASCPGCGARFEDGP